MSYYRVNHIDRLNGEVKIQGSKNAALPIIAAAIMNKGITVIRNCPDIYDVINMIKILGYLGCKYAFSDNVLEIDANSVNVFDIPKEDVSKLRASVVLLGALLGRYGRARISYPGGCKIGDRKIDVHLEILKELGYDVKADEHEIVCSGKIKDDCKVKLRVKSVGATENGILASVLAKGKTVTLCNVAREPEIVNLCEMLNRMGADIRGIGSSEIIIKGVEELHTAVLDVYADRIVAGTYMAAVSAVGGKIVLKDISGEFDKGIINTLKAFGNRCKYGENEILIENRKNINEVEKNIIISTQVYPGFPTDMQSQVMAVLCCGARNGIIIENIFENRLGTAQMLNKMGADIKVINNRIAVINSVKCLHGAEVEALDLRSGAALIIAGLMAEDYTIIRNGDYILRGYQSIQEDMKMLSAKVELYN